MSGAERPSIAISRRALLGSAMAAAVAGCVRDRAASPPLPDPSAPGPALSSILTPGPAVTTPTPLPTSSEPPADLEVVLARATVPVLCWHQLRDWRPADSAYSRRFLVCPPTVFRAQLDALTTDGWTTITPDQYLAHLLTGAPLPQQAVLLSFDDSQGTQATEALPQLQAREMHATFFAMTVVLDKPNWLSSDGLRHLHAAGMTVAAHTFDHQRVDRYTGADWRTQLQQPREQLEKILRAPVEHFAYPYGTWNSAAVQHVQAAGYRTAFQLADHPTFPQAPVHTLRRILADSSWTGRQLLDQLRPN